MSLGVPTLMLPRTLEAGLLRGDFWVYRNHIPAEFSAPVGSWVCLRAGRFIGFGLWDPSSAIAVRIFSRKAVPDRSWVAERVSQAWALRKALRQTRTSAFRWVGGEGDGFPGMVVDYYAGFVVLRTYSDALESLVAWVVEALQATTQLRGVVRRQRRDETERAELLAGRMPPRELVVEEHGVRFLADLVSGQKTGLFLDQRENRRFVASLARDCRVLNLFAYSGGFGLHAALGGAARVTSVDAAPLAMADARRNFELNGMDPETHEFLVEDAYEYVRQAKAHGEQFELVISDPPSLGHAKSQVRQAGHAYRRLFGLCLAVTQPGGFLAAGSCTAQVSPELFREVLTEAAERSRSQLQIVYDAGHPLDHPVFAHHPQGRYLKFIVGRKLLAR